MHNIALTKVDQIKSLLCLKFSGKCGIGSLGNDDADFIVQVAHDKLVETKNIQGLILDFTDLDYEFGNRFIKLFDPNVFKNNSKLMISIVPKNSNINNWKSLCEFAGFGNDFFDSEIAIFQFSVTNAVRSINRRLNRKENDA